MGGGDSERGELRDGLGGADDDGEGRRSWTSSPSWVRDVSEPVVVWTGICSGVGESGCPVGFGGGIEHWISSRPTQFPCRSRWCPPRMVAVESGRQACHCVVRLQGVVSCTFLAFPDFALSDTIVDTCMMPVGYPPGHRADNYGRRGLSISDRVTSWSSVPVVFVLPEDKAKCRRRNNYT